MGVYDRLLSPSPLLANDILRRRPQPSNSSSNRWRFKDEIDIDIKVSEALGKHVAFTINKMNNMGMMTPFCGSKENLDLMPNIMVSCIPYI